MEESNYPRIAKYLGRPVARAGVLLVCVLLALGLAPASRAASLPVLRLSAPAQVEVGASIPITLMVDGAADLAGYEAALRFDTAAAELGGLDQRDNDLKRAGRDVGPLSVTSIASGSALGLFSCPVASCADASGAWHAAGAGGSLKLASVEVVALRPGVLEIALGAAKFVDAAGQPVAIDLSSATIAVQVGAPGAGPRYPAPASPWSLAVPASGAAATPDLNGDGRVTYADVVQAALEWTRARERGAPCGALDDPRVDQNGDGCIDVADLQLIAASYSTPAPHPPAQAAAALTFVVNSTGDSADTNIGDGICRTSSGTCTLRAAIYEANAHPGPDTIAFNISGTGVHNIQLNNLLPPLNDASGGTTIDGYTQPGASPNTDPVTSNAVIKVEIAGRGSTGIDGLPITAAGNVVRGLSFYNFHRSIWMYGLGSHDNAVVGNFIGTNAAATFVSTSTYTDAHGVHLSQGASRNHVGGTAPADRNVISGNGRSGVGLWDQGTDANVIMNNIVGLAPGGDRRVRNLWHGIDMNLGVSYTIVGGTGPGEHNVIAGNSRQGIEVSHAANTSFNRVIGNYVGTDLTGTRSPTYAINYGFGIQMKDRVVNNVVSGNVVGSSRMGGIRVDEYGNCCVGHNEISNNRVGISLDGTAIPNSVAGIYITAGNTQVGPGNIIANNPIGIRIEGPASDRNTITRNSIFGNTGLGIDLAPIGSVNQNDSGDGDSGPNQQLNFPVLSTATTRVVSGTACAGCTVEIFVATGGAGAYGEGRTFVGSATAASGGAFTATISGAAAGDFLTATATDSQGNTSEFGLNRVVVAEVAPGIESLSPRAASAGDPAFQLTINGSNFAGDAVALWNGAPRPTRVVSASRLVVDISAADIAAPGVATVSVVNQTSQMASNTVAFNVSAGAPQPLSRRLYLPLVKH
jgi:CSLREA domain-containing protein